MVKKANTNRTHKPASSGKPSYEELEAALQECEAKYRAAFEHSLIGLYRTTPGGRILLVNQALLKMLGYKSLAKLAKRNLEHSGYEPRYPRSLFKKEIEKSGHVLGIESAWLRKDKSVLYVRESARAVRDDRGKTIYYEGTVEDITDRKTAHERLRLLSSIVEQSGEGIALVDMKGRVKFANRAFAEMHGYTPEELAGKHLMLFHSKQQAKSVEAVIRRIRKSGSFQGEVWRKRRDGSIFPSVMNNSLLRGENGEALGMIAVMRDETESKRAAQDLQEAHERLNATLNALPDILFEVDRKGRILDFRAPDPQMLFRKPSEFLGRTIFECLPGPAAKTIMQSIKRAVKSGQDRGATYSLKVKEDIRWFELSLAVKGDPRSPRRNYTALVRDITDRKRSENELRDATTKLKAEQVELKEKNIALKQILDHIAQEKKNFRRQLSRDLEQTIRPHLRRLKSAEPPPSHELERLEAALHAVLTRESDDFEGRMANLTPREKEICEMIENGLSSKQISSELVVSTATVNKHREQIRKKLGITNKSVNLNSFLRARKTKAPTY